MKKITITLLLLTLILVAVAGTVFWTPDLPKAQLEAKYTNEASAFAILPSGSRVHYRLYGENNAQKLVLLHGSNASLHTWEPWVEKLKAQFNILTIDLPGHGLTGPIPLADYGRVSMANSVKELVDELGFDNFILGGNSMGGAVSLQYTALYPNDVKGLVLVSSSGINANIDTDENNRKKSTPPLAFRLSGSWYGDWILKRITPRALVEEGIQRSISVKRIIHDDMIDRYHDLARYPGSRHATSLRFQAYKQGIEQIDFARILQPSLLIWGDEDNLVPVDRGEKMHALLPNSRLEVLINTGHLAMEERANATAQLVSEFAKELTSNVWRSPKPANLLVMQLDSGEVVIELAPQFAPKHVDNIKKLVVDKYFDGLAVVRSQDNYVVQWGDPNSENNNKKPLGSAASRLTPEFKIPLATLNYTKIESADSYANEVGFVDGFPVASDGETAWLTHCYGAVGVARGVEPNSGNGSGLYVVIGHAPRHLDLNVTLVGRVIKGIEKLSTLPRGTGALGFYETTDEYIPIRSISLADKKQASQFSIMRTKSADFKHHVKNRTTRTDPWFLEQIGKIELCNVGVPMEF